MVNWCLRTEFQVRKKTELMEDDVVYMHFTRQPRDASQCQIQELEFGLSFHGAFLA